MGLHSRQNRVNSFFLDLEAMRDSLIPGSCGRILYLLSRTADSVLCRKFHQFRRNSSGKK